MAKDVVQLGQTICMETISNGSDGMLQADR
jgi:hypothetical protein